MSTKKIVILIPIFLLLLAAAITFRDAVRVKMSLPQDTASQIDESPLE